MSDIESIDFDKFYNDNKTRFNEFALLFGNGLIKSYPKNAPKYDEVLNSVSLKKIELEKAWENVEEHINKVFEYEIAEISPENLLNVLRRVYSFCVFEQFIKKQSKLNSKEIWAAREFLKLFKSTYTLNYDYLTYISIFKDSFCESKENIIKDGFYSSNPIPLTSIEKSLNSGKPFRFLHGAFHIFQQIDGKYYKVVACDGYFLDNVQKKYNDIYNNIPHLLYPEEYPQDNPIIVFSGKFGNKLAMINSNTYLRYCLDCLLKEEKIFAFGCSFKLDSHILDTIFKDAEGKRRTVEAYLGYFDEKDKNVMCKYIQENGIDPCNVTFVNLSDITVVSEKVWGQQTLIERASRYFKSVFKEK